MSTWTDRPPTDDSVPALRVLRTPPHRPFRSRILSTDIIGAMTHYHNGRTAKCNAPDCAICALGMRPRWYGYFAIYNPTSAARAIFEIPRGAYIAFDDYIIKYKTLRGAFLDSFRKPDRPNGQVVVHLEPPKHDTEDFPDEPDVFRTLCQMWGLDWRAESTKRAEAAHETAPDPAPRLFTDRTTNPTARPLGPAKPKDNGKPTKPVKPAA